MMRVLRIYPFLPPLPGGMEKHVQRLTQEQRLLGCDVITAFNQGEATSLHDLRILSIVNLRRVKPQALRDLIFYLAALVCVLFGGIRADVVHIHGDWSAFLFGRVLRWAVGADVMAASVHGAVRKGAWTRLYKCVLNGYGVVYCTGAADAAYLRQAGVVAARWQNSGIDAEFLIERSPPPIAVTMTDVVCVANFLPVKNLALVIQIARHLQDANFVLIGDGPQRPELVAACEKESLHNVRFAGKLSAKEICQQLRASRIFLSTSFSEGTPTALLEAMACGLPVVTSCSNDYRELITNGWNGYVIENFDAKNYVNVLRDLLSNQSLQGQISMRNKSEARRHAWPEVAKRITEWMRVRTS
jgi:glycosyltransferase involved in cell wall biosynthesis